MRTRPFLMHFVEQELWQMHLKISSLSFVSLIVDLEDYYSVVLGDDELDFSVYDTIGELLMAFSDN